MCWISSISKEFNHAFYKGPEKGYNGGIMNRKYRTGWSSARIQFQISRSNELCIRYFSFRHLSPLLYAFSGRRICTKKRPWSMLKCKDGGSLTKRLFKSVLCPETCPRNTWGPQPKYTMRSWDETHNNGCRIWKGANILYQKRIIQTLLGNQ